MQLPVADSPLSGYMMYSYHLGVSLAHVRAEPWFYGNFVQLQCDPAHLDLQQRVKYTDIAKGEVHFTEGTSRFNPWLRDCETMDKQALTATGEPVSRIFADRIASGCYIETFVDEFYIPSLLNGRKAHFRHRLLLHGFDEGAQRFDIVGFDPNKIYRRLTCSFAELDEAFSAVEPQWFEKTKFFKPDPAREVVFDRSRLAQILREYLSCTNSLLDSDLHGAGGQDDGQLWFGIKTYTFLLEYARRMAEQSALRVDIRGFHLVWEHKKVMLARMKWLRETGHAIDDRLVNDFSRVVALCELARNRAIMHARGFGRPGSTHLQEIPTHLAQARELEGELLTRLLHCLN